MNEKNLLEQASLVCEHSIRKAGELVKQGFESEERELSFKDKAHNDYLTKYDKLSQDTIVKEIKKIFPKHNFLGEEKLSSKTKSEYTWVIDPIDGTRPFSRGIPTFMISIALTKKNKTLICMLHNPISKELYSAQKNCGAYLNGKKLKVSNIKIKNSHIEFVSAHNRERKEEVLPHFFKYGAFVNSYYSQCYSISLICSGRHEGIISEFGGPWDYASYLLVEEAGGKVTDYNGKPFDLSKNNIIISNGTIHKDLQNYIKKFPLKK